MQFRETSYGWFLRMEKGEKIHESLIDFARKKEIKSATTHGLGAVQNAELGCYDLNKKEYLHRNFPEALELLSLTGNITWLDGAPFPHSHVSLSDHEFRAFGGHLFEAEVAVTLEMSLQTHDFVVERKMDESVGLCLIEVK